MTYLNYTKRIRKATIKNTVLFNLKGCEQMAKMGRPKKSEIKNNSIGIRLANDQYSRLMQYASEHELTITQVVQRALELLFQSS